MGRVYSVNVDDITIAAADTPQDFIVITAPSTTRLRIIGAQITQVSDYADANAGGLRVTFNRYATIGSGGTTISTLPPLDTASPAATFTAKRGTALGATPTLLASFAFNVQAGFFYDPIPEAMIYVPVSGLFAITLPEDGTGTASSLDLSGFLLVEEL